MMNSSKSLTDCLKQNRPMEADISAKAEFESEQTQIPLEQLLTKQDIVSANDLISTSAEYLDIRTKRGNLPTVAMFDPFNLVMRDPPASSHLERAVIIPRESER